MRKCSWKNKISGRLYETKATTKSQNNLHAKKKKTNTEKINKLKTRVLPNTFNTQQTSATA